MSLSKLLQNTTSLINGSKKACKMELLRIITSQLSIWTSAKAPKSSHLLWSSNYDRQIKAFAFPLITYNSDSGIVPSWPSVPHRSLISHIDDLEGSFLTPLLPVWVGGQNTNGLFHNFLWESVAH